MDLTVADGEEGVHPEQTESVDSWVSFTRT